MSRGRWNGFCCDESLPVSRGEPVTTSEQAELCLLAGIRFSQRELDGDRDVQEHCISALLLDKCRYNATFQERIRRKYATRSRLVDRLILLEWLDDADARWQEVACALYSDCLADGDGLESRWTLFAFMECVRRYIVTGCDESALELLTAFVRRHATSRRPLTRLFVSCALEAHATLLPETANDERLWLLMRAAMHNDVLLSAIHLRALAALLAATGQSEHVAMLREHMKTLGWSGVIQVAFSIARNGNFSICMYNV